MSDNNLLSNCCKLSVDLQKISTRLATSHRCDTMSMDLAVWSTRDFNFPAELPRPTSWKRYHEELTFDEANWQVLVLSEQSEPDPSVVHKLPGANFVAWISLEPIGAEPDGYAFIEEVVRSVAREVGGVWVDPNGLAYFHNEGNF